MADPLDQRIRRINQTLASEGRVMNPCLTEEGIQVFEERYKVQLPPPYRLFLKEVGNGGEGPPQYGLCSLGEVPADFDRTAGEVLNDLAQPFPLTNYWVWEGEPDRDPELFRAIDHGNLVLGTDGCAMYWLLIITGLERGQVWLRADVGIQPCAPRRDFLSWYEYWLEGGSDWWAEFTPS